MTENIHIPCFRFARSGFTVLELLIALGCVGLLAALLLPAVQRARDAAHRTGCQNHMRQIALAVHNAEMTHGYIPPNVRSFQRPPPEWPHPNGMTWFAFLLPELGQTPTHARAVAAFQADPSPHSDAHAGPREQVIATFVCPADNRLRRPWTDTRGRRAAFGSYLGVSGNLPDVSGPVPVNGVITDGYVRVRFTDVTDGLSNTLMVGERPPDDGGHAGWWYTYHPNPGGPDGTCRIESWNTVHPPCSGTDGPGGIRFRFGPGRTDNRCDVFHFWSLHTDGGNFALADGSVRFVPYAASPALAAMGSRNGGELLAD